MYQRFKICFHYSLELIVFGLLCYILLFQMPNITLIDAWDAFYICATKFNGYSKGTLIALGFIYNIAGIISGILNVYLLYLFAARKKLRKPSNLVMCPLLWTNIFLVFGVIPMTLLELYITKLQINKHYISIRYYLSLTYIVLCFYSVMSIAFFRMLKIKNGVLQKNDESIWKQLSCKMLGMILSGTFPFLKAALSIEYGTKGIFAASTILLVIVLFAMVLCYGMILHVVKVSQRNMRKKSSNKETSRNKRILRKLKRNINLIMGSFSLLLIPCFANAMFYSYALNDNDFFEKNVDLINTIQLACFTIFLFNGISSPLVYFYTQTEIKQEVKSLSECRKSSDFFNHLKSRLEYIRSSTNRSMRSTELETITD